jgi:hypothetical protein
MADMESIVSLIPAQLRQAAHLQESIEVLCHQLAALRREEQHRKSSVVNSVDAKTNLT